MAIQKICEHVKNGDGTYDTIYKKTSYDLIEGLSDNYATKAQGNTADALVSGSKTAAVASSCTGNSSTATKLATARTINGVAFDGTSNITVADDTKVPINNGRLTFELNTGVVNLEKNSSNDSLIMSFRQNGVWKTSPFNINSAGIFNTNGNSETATTATTATKAANCNGDYFNFPKGGYVKNTGVQQMYFRASTEESYALSLGVVENRWALCPDVDGNLTLGTPNKRWGQIFSNSSTISTSDRNEKKNIAAANSEIMMRLLLKLIPVSFKYIDGTSGRTHYGFIAQDVEQALIDCGISDMDFAAFIKSPKYETVQVFTDEYLDEDTFEIVPASIHEESVIVPNEYIYGLRYEEFIAPMLSVIQSQQNQIISLDSTIKLMNERLVALETNK